MTNYTLYILVLIGALLVSVLLAPFFLGRGGLLQASGQINSKSTLADLKDAILRRYLEDEKAHKCGALSRLSWGQRQAYLSHRYIDAARRLDFLEHLEQEAKTSAGSSGGTYA